MTATFSPTSDDVTTTDRLSTIAPAGRHLGARWIRDVLVLKPQGRLGQEMIGQLDQALEAVDAPVVIDLDDCILSDHRGVGPDVVERWSAMAPELAFSCRRLSARRLLARGGLAERFAVFQRIEDALQAKTLYDCGYGDGWRHR
jgi:hypothetical protein